MSVKSLRCGLIFAIVLIALFGPVSSKAQLKPSISVQYTSADKSGPAWLIVNGRIAARFVAPNAGLSPSRRAEIAAERLQILAQRKTNFDTIKAEIIPALGKIMGPGGAIFYITPEDAKLQSSTVQALTKQVAAVLRKLLTMPPLELAKTSVTVPVGDARRVEVSGSLLDPFTVQSNAPEIASAVPADNAREIIITGNQPGSAVVTVQCGEYSASVSVTVKKYAASPAKSLVGTVTGTPAPAELCQSAALLALMRNLNIEPGASFSYGKFKASSLRPGEKQTIKIPVRVEGANYLPFIAELPVLLTNVALPRPNASVLMYSNDPERLTKYGVLYVGRVSMDAPARLLYHHQNAMGAAAIFDIEIINNSPTDCRMHLIRATPEPRVDTVLIGYRAGIGFMRNYLANIGEVIEIPANSKVSLYSTRLANMETASGIIELALLGGGPVTVQVSAKTPQTAVAFAGLPVPISGGDGNLPVTGHLYSPPVKLIDSSYSVGGPWSFIRIGKQAIKSALEDHDRELYGNYGVIYEIRLKLNNPTSMAQTVKVLFEPSAGIASGIFWIDGQVISTTHRKPPAEVALASYKLEPNQSKSVLIKTIPLSGSNYPATILVRS